MKIQIKKLHPEAKIPRFALEGDAGLDLYSVSDVILKPGQRISCPTGIAIKIPNGHVGLIWDKGGPSHKFGIKTLGGVFDSNYTGEYQIGLINLGQNDFVIEEVQNLNNPPAGGGVAWERLEYFGLEYRWIARYLQKKISLAGMKEKLYFDIIHYAKRQMTWFKKDKRIHWLKNYTEIEKAAKRFLT